MILKYGTYAHQVHECSVVISKDAIFNDRGQAIGFTEHWRIEGYLQADTPALLTVAIQAFEDAYETNGKDLHLYLEDGVTDSAHRILNSATTGGVRVTHVGYPEGDGADYTTFRKYELDIEAEVRDRSIGLIAWDEVLTFRGTCGPRFVYLETLNGPPVKQQVAAKTTMTATQSGRAVGQFAHPTRPGPIWPSAEKQEQREYTKRLPRRQSRNNVEYEVIWSYSFESNQPLNGNPTNHA